VLFPNSDRLCGLVVRVSGYRSRGPGFDSRSFQIFWEAAVWNGIHSASWGQLRSYLEEIVAAPVKKTETNDRGILCADHATPSIRKSWHYFPNKRRSLGRHSSIADQCHGVFLFLFPNSSETSRKARHCETIWRHRDSVGLTRLLLQDKRQLNLMSLLGHRSRYSDWLRAGWLMGWSLSPGRVKNFLCSTSSRLVLGPTQPPIQSVPVAPSPGLKLPGREADHLKLVPRSRKCGLCIHSPIRLHGLVLN
jgi:hypothetical protein